MRGLPTAHGDARTRGALRAFWLEALDRAAQVGAAAEGGEILERDDATLFAGLAVRAAAAPFALPYASARSAAEGFKHLARGFVAAAQPELKRALGGAMAAAARCCRRMIELEIEQEAAAWRRRHGDD